MKAPCLALFAAALSGIWLEAWFKPPAWLAITTFCIATAGSCTGRFKKQTRDALILFSFGLYFMGRAACVLPPVAPHIFASSLARPYRARVVAPIVRQCRGNFCTYKTQLLLQEVCHQNRWIPTSGRVAVALLDLGGAVVRGDVLQVRLRIEALPERRAPWAPSRSQQAIFRGAWDGVRVEGVHVPWHVGGGLMGLLDRMRTSLAAHLDAHLSHDAAALARALALGDQAGLQTRVRDSWGDAGLAHLLAISGLHVTIVARAAGFMGYRAGCLWRRYFPKPISHLPKLFGAGAAAGGVWLYVALAGLPIAAIRAAWMITFSLCGRVLRRRHARADALGLAGLLILSQTPWAARQAAFLLSFASVGALLALPPPQPDKTPRLLPKTRLQRFGTKISQAWLVGLATTIATAPLCAWFFGRLAWVGPLANLVAVPVATLVLTPLALATALSKIFSSSTRPLAWLFEKVVGVMQIWADGCGGLGGGAFMVPQPKPLEMTGLGVLLVGGGLRYHRRKSWASMAWVWVFATGLVACGALPRWQSSRGDGLLTLFHLDVGQGDATLVRFPDGRHILIDGGGASYAGQPDPGRLFVAPALRALGVNRLNGVLVTHPHPDHIMGLHFILEHWPVDVLWRSEEAGRSDQVKKLEALVEARGGHVLLPPTSCAWAGVCMDFIHPLPQQKASANDHSVVLKLQYGNSSALLLGDVEARAEAWLAQRLTHADVVKLGHHGSKTSSTAPLLAAIRPDMAVISCGQHNRFGFPHSEVTQRLEAFNVKVLRTDTMGVIALQTDAEQWSWRTAAQGWELTPYTKEEDALSEGGP